MCKGRWQRVRQSYYAIMDHRKAIVKEKTLYLTAVSKQALRRSDFLHTSRDPFVPSEYG